MTIPGRHVERITFSPSQLVPRTQMKKPIPAVMDDINRKYKVKITRTDGAAGASIFAGVGPIEPTRAAMKELASIVGSKVSHNTNS